MKVLQIHFLQAKPLKNDFTFSLAEFEVKVKIAPQQTFLFFDNITKSGTFQDRSAWFIDILWPCQHQLK